MTKNVQFKVKVNCCFMSNITNRVSFMAIVTINQEVVYIGKPQVSFAATFSRSFQSDFSFLIWNTAAA